MQTVILPHYKVPNKENKNHSKTEYWRGDCFFGKIPNCYRLLYDVTNFIELPVFFVVHVILEKSMHLFISPLQRNVYKTWLRNSRPTYPASDWPLDDATRHWGNIHSHATLGNTVYGEYRKESKIEVEVCLLKNYGKTTVVIYNICPGAVLRWATGAQAPSLWLPPDFWRFSFFVTDIVFVMTKRATMGIGLRPLCPHLTL